MEANQLSLLETIWNEHFPRDRFYIQDPRIMGIKLFYDFFVFFEPQEKKKKLHPILQGIDLSNHHYLYFNIEELNKLLGFQDFIVSVRGRPNEVLGCMGLALSLVVQTMNPYLERAKVIRVRLYGLDNDISFIELKSSVVGQLVSVKGHVVRVSACRPLVESASFLCPKCMQYTKTYFEDGIFTPPSICRTEKCNNKFLEVERSSVVMTDFQRMKLTELDEQEQEPPNTHKRNYGSNSYYQSFDEEREEEEENANTGSTMEAQKGSWRRKKRKRNAFRAEDNNNQSNNHNYRNNIDNNSSSSNPNNSNNVARIPRTMEVEVRGSLVNTCIAGDILVVVGIVKSLQVSAPKVMKWGAAGGGGGGIKESGLHEFYLLASSLRCLKSSGDRVNSNTRNTLLAADGNVTNINNCTNASIASENNGGSGVSSNSPAVPLTLIDSRPSIQLGVPTMNHIHAIDDQNTQNTHNAAVLEQQTYYPQSSTHHHYHHYDDEHSRNNANYKNNINNNHGINPNDSVLFTHNELCWIRSLAHSSEFGTFALLVQSICPSIFGHELVKAGLLLGLFGGSAYRFRPQTNNSSCGSGDSSYSGTANTAATALSYNHKNEFKVRADIHVLVVGDPGLGKSQLLRAAANVSPRAVFVCANTSTAAGLTVTISRDGAAGGKGDLCIEAGALVLADQGVCCIDELDKMQAEQHSLLEAMEQQSISVAKSGVVTSLKSRCAVLAAANPSGGHYNKRKSGNDQSYFVASLSSFSITTTKVCENLKMNAALLSRFDLVFILLDQPDELHDRLVSEHIMGLKERPYNNNNNNNNSNNYHDKAGSSSSSICGSGGANTTTSCNTTSYTSTNQCGRNEEEREGEDNGNNSNYTLAQRLRLETRRIQLQGIPDELIYNNAVAADQTSNSSSSYHTYSRGKNSNGINNCLPAEMIRRYIEYAKKYVQPSLSPSAAKVLQQLYLNMRAQAALGEAVPVTTRHLESLIRLAQARARIDLREVVTESDARDVVQMLQESLLEVFTNDVGVLDTSRKGGISLAKQVKALVKVMTRECSLRENGAGDILNNSNQRGSRTSSSSMNSNIFTKQDIQELCVRLGLSREVDDLIEVMRTECYLLLKGSRLYQLQTSAS